MQVTIPRIEGNSKLGNAVYSNMGKKDNYRYIVFQPSYEEEKNMRDALKQHSEMQQQIKQYRAFSKELPQMEERLKDRVKQVGNLADATEKNKPRELHTTSDIAGEMVNLGAANKAAFEQAHGRKHR